MFGGAQRREEFERSIKFREAYKNLKKVDPDNELLGLAKINFNEGRDIFEYSVSKKMLEKYCPKGNCSEKRWYQSDWKNVDNLDMYISDLEKEVERIRGQK